MGGGTEIVVVRIKEGRCPSGAYCISIGRIIPRPDVVIPDGDYLVIMSPSVAYSINLSNVVKKFKCVICVGPSTAEAVGNCIVPREYTSYGVARLLKELAPGRVVVLRSSAGNEVLKTLVPNVIEVPVYDIVLDRDRIEEAAKAIVMAKAVVFTSSTAVEAVAKAVDLTGKTVVAIGAVTSQKLTQLGIPHITAGEATIEEAVKTAKKELELFKPK
ncbi:Uroporphyrinogen III synthase HEM4 [Pyrobaculum islandicum DSM 4184]|uniref:Uroporphyrinogen III synthase HEM4 n=1 Tax=Pyrobaculum islandicum (strain DSM 4184 / JCM 9189 / GEO3) TaxID=384616 RepID=A1RQR7_PYRIL|nr:uroporphyrinogen-III synthase [Pyrobaculum islandicum]ABL87299.1 Uroporphyrinogen III synthase HEM4 [Pyrobaculum islandicum DSM 4184]